MVKWILRACELDNSNLYALLRFSNFQPYEQGRWAPSLEYFTLLFQAKKGSKAWT